MQTEEVGPDEIPILKPLPDSEMTVKEEIETPLELPCTTIAKNQLTILDELNCDFDDTLTGHQFSPFEGLRSIPGPLLKDTPLGINLHENPTSCSIVSSIASTSSSPSPQQKIEKEKNRSKRRSRWKLKFHHQALPPEYLDHYEATVAQQEAAAAKADAKAKSNAGNGSAKTANTAPVHGKSSSVDKTDKFLSTGKCCMKVESQTSRYETPTMDKSHILPIQTLSINDDDSSKNQADDLSTNEKPTLLYDKSHFTNEKFLCGKGLLGTLLTNSLTSDSNSKSVAENERKRKSVIMSTSSGNSNGNNITINRSPTPTNCGASSNTKIRNYQDLPYMGEITLDNMKPRRGRKPKKADICHLIYKNYGTTVLPGTPLRGNFLDNEDWSRKKLQQSPQRGTSPTMLNQPDIRLKQENYREPSIKCKPLEFLKQSPVSHSDVQNRIICSLLEKRLSQDIKNTTFTNSCFVPTSPYAEKRENTITTNQNSWSENGKPTTSVTDEPLNLCVKDLNQLKIRLLRKHGNFYEPRVNDVVIKTEPASPINSQEPEASEPHTVCPSKFHEETDVSVSPNRTPTKSMRSESENTCEPFGFSEGDCSRTTTPVHITSETGISNASVAGGYIYWPSAGVFVHPMALQSQFLYYQKMGAIPLVPISPAETSTFLPSHAPQVNLISHINAAPSQNPHIASKAISRKDQKSNLNKTLIPKAFSMMTDTSPKPTTTVSAGEINFSRLKRLAPLGNPPTTISSTTTTKRKRSAIFIPPMPSENSSNPTTEVSICKFKFTGGAKPSLQEKKMLSVDSGGNFRYYSGTGDKSMRGYEFFPREALQQSGSIGGTSSEQFIAASTTNGNERVGNSCTTLVSDEKKPQQFHLPALGEQSSKVDGRNARSGDVESAAVRYVPPNDERESQSGCVRKRNESCSKGRHGSGSADSERFAPKEDEQVANSQMRMRRKRKTRKSLAREKLEQTFKEKGFLIQTQQLESAEGATYCKFRQLRKFTRYLFRSWKDYLPGNVREMSVAAGVSGPESSPSEDVGPVESEVDGELSCSNSPSPSFQHISESPKTFPSM